MVRHRLAMGRKRRVIAAGLMLATVGGVTTACSSVHNAACDKAQEHGAPFLDLSPTGAHQTLRLYDPFSVAVPRGSGLGPVTSSHPHVVELTQPPHMGIRGLQYDFWARTTGSSILRSVQSKPGTPRRVWSLEITVPCHIQ